MGLALGTYPGAIGETFSIAIILVGIYLAFRQVIDWRVPVTYLGGIFVLTAIVALLTGIESYHGICIAIVGLGVSFYAASSIEPVTKIESEATSMVVDNVPVEHVQEEVSL